MRLSPLLGRLGVVVFALASPSMVVLGCATPEVVHCEDGRFARVEGEPWCLYDRRQASMTRCPAELPEDHRLPWGGLGCAKTRFDPLPPGLCEPVDECSPPDGGP